MRTNNVNIRKTVDELEKGLTLEACDIMSERTGVVFTATRTYSGDTLKVMKAVITDIENGVGWELEEITGGTKYTTATLVLK